MQAVAPAQAWTEFRSKLAGVVGHNEDDKAAELAFEADGGSRDYPMVFRKRRARRVARLAESFRDDWRLGVFKALPSAAPATAGSRSPMDVLEHLANRLHLIAQQLARRHDNRETLRIGDEYDVQDLLHSLLLLEFEDVRPEEHTPSYAGGSARMDFLLKAEQVVVEVKCARAGLGPKEVGDQLMVDIVRYHNHQDCKMLFCLVYDSAGMLKNPRGLESDLSRDWDGLPTRVRIRPRFS